ncbi:MAG: peptidylprolyl isomerase [Candidatus Nitrospinota bacterium M3_3B_026]
MLDFARALRPVPYALLIMSVLAVPGVFGQEKKPAGEQAAKEPMPPFAKVNDVVLTLQDFRGAMIQAVRSKYYHGKVPEGEMAVLQREVGRKMVDRILLVEEARRRGLEPDSKKVDKQITMFDDKYAGSERWKAERDRIIPGLRKQMEEDSLVEVLEEQVKGSVDPSEAQVREYYEQNPDKFTEPEQVKVSAILLKVEPSSPKEVWEKAIEEAKDIKKRIEDGGDFAELARIHSGDPSAEKGGDMGYLHRGMLAENVHKALDEISAGDVTDPVVILQGVGVFRLDDRKQPKLNEFKDVRERAEALLKRELAEKAWEDLKSRLREGASIEINESYYLPAPKDDGDEKEEKGGAEDRLHG